jgi:hypothetical protein
MNKDILLRLMDGESSAIELFLDALCERYNVTIKNGEQAVYYFIIKAAGADVLVMEYEHTSFSQALKDIGMALWRQGLLDD